MLRTPVSGGATTCPFTSDPRVLSKLTGTRGLLEGWPFPYSPGPSLQTQTHFISHTHTESQPLSLNKSDKPPWWLLWPIREENNTAGIRQLQSPRQAGLQSALKGRASTPESWSVSQLSVTPLRLLSSAPMHGWCHYWSLWRTIRGVSYHWQVQSLAGSPMRIHDFEAIGLKLQTILFCSTYSFNPQPPAPSVHECLRTSTDSTYKSAQHPSACTYTRQRAVQRRMRETSRTHAHSNSSICGHRYFPE